MEDKELLDSIHDHPEQAMIKSIHYYHGGLEDLGVRITFFEDTPNYFRQQMTRLQCNYPDKVEYVILEHDKTSIRVRPVGDTELVYKDLTEGSLMDSKSEYK
jgi:hypothetical protein